MEIAKGPDNLHNSSHVEVGKESCKVPLNDSSGRQCEAAAVRPLHTFCSLKTATP